MLRMSNKSTLLWFPPKAILLFSRQKREILILSRELSILSVVLFVVNEHLESKKKTIPSLFVKQNECSEVQLIDEIGPVLGLMF